MLRRHWMITTGVLSSRVMWAQSYPFVLDSSKPFAYLRFSRIGARKPARQGELRVGLWLELVNNCRLSIAAVGRDLGTGDPGVALDYRVVRGATAVASTKMPPEGYSFDVGSPLVVISGASLLFSLPADHVTDDWHIEVDLRFELPGRTTERNPRIVVSFFSDDIPAGSRLSR
jgi:hypothetical protein